MSRVQIVDDFLNTFQVLSEKRQKIWRYIQWFCRQYRNVFPSQETIAKACGCHRLTVNEAMAYFAEMGWINKARRAFRSCLYSIAEVLLGIDTFKPTTFYREKTPLFSKPETTTKPTNKPTNKPTVLESNKSIKMNDNVVKDEIKQVPQINDERSVQNNHLEKIASKVPIEIAYLPVSNKDKQILTTYSKKDRGSFLFALEDYKTYSLINAVNNAAAFITSRFKYYVSNKLNPKPENNEIIPETLIINNKSLAANTLKKLWINELGEVRKGVYADMNSSYVEIGDKVRNNVIITYNDPQFSVKLHSSLKSWNILHS